MVTKSSCLHWRYQTQMVSVKDVWKNHDDDDDHDENDYDDDDNDDDDEEEDGDNGNSILYRTQN